MTVLGSFFHFALLVGLRDPVTHAEGIGGAAKYQRIQSIALRHLEELGEVAPVHVVTDPKADPAIADVVTSTYGQRHPVLLWRDDDRGPVCTDASCPKIRHFVGVFEDIGDIKPVDWKAFYGTAWDSKSKFAIWITGDVFPEVVQSVFESFWSLGCVNVVFLVANATDVEAYGYDPFWVRGENRGRVHQHNSTQLLFPDKLNNLRGHSIAVSMYETYPVVVLGNYTRLVSGIDVEMIRYLAKSLNFSIELVTAPIFLSSYSTRLPSGEVVGPVGDLLKNRSDVLGNSQPLDGVAERDVDWLQPHGYTPARVVVPAGGTMPGIVRTFRSIDVDLFVILTSLLSLVALCMAARRHRQPVLDAFRLLIFQTFRGIGARTSERLFCITWIVFLYLFSSIYQGHLIKDLTDPPFYRSIDSLQELARSDVPIFMDKSLFRTLNNSDSALKRRLADNARIEVTFDACMRRLNGGSDVACAGDIAAIAHAVYVTWKTRRRRTHVMADSVTEFWRTFVVRRGFPFLRKFEQVVQRSVQYGLLAKWRDETFSTFIKFKSAAYRTPLSMNHFEGIFKILLIGQSVAAFVLLAEVAWSRVKWKLRGDGGADNDAWQIGSL